MINILLTAEGCENMPAHLVFPMRAEEVQLAKDQTDQVSCFRIDYVSSGFEWLDACLRQLVLPEKHFEVRIVQQLNLLAFVLERMTIHSLSEMECSLCDGLSMEDLINRAYYYADYAAFPDLVPVEQFRKYYLGEEYSLLRKEERGKYPVPRMTGGALFSRIFSAAEAAGDLQYVKPILDYTLPSETGIITNYEFDFVPQICFGGSEGIYMLKTVCCDGSRIFSTQKPCEYDTGFSVLLPDRAASLLAGLVKEEDILSLHTAQGCVQFRTQNFLYAAAPIRCAYFPVDAVISSMSPVSSAVVNAKQLCDSLELAAAASSPIINLTITSEAVQLRPLSRLVKADLPPVTAKKCKATDGKGFYYRTYKLLQGCQAFLGTNDGSIKMWMTKGGAMVLEAPGSYYMLPVSKPPKAKKAESKKAA